MREDPCHMTGETMSSKNDIIINIWNFSSFFFFAILGPTLWHMEVPRLRVESEL